MSDGANNPTGAPAGTDTKILEQGDAGDTTAKDTNGADGQSYLLDYATREDAEKGIKESQAFGTKKAQEAAEYKRELEDLRRDMELEKLNASVGEMAGYHEQMAKKSQEEAQQAQLQALIDRAEEEGVGVVINEMNAAFYDRDKRLSERERAIDDRIKELESKFTGRLDKTARELSPEYQSLKPMIDALKAKPAYEGWTEDQIMTVARELKASEPQDDPASVPPGMGGARVGAVAPEEKKGLTDDEKYRLKHIAGWNDEEIDRMDRRKRGEKV